MHSRKVVVAGGTGLIGRAVTQHLAANGWDVVVLTRSSKKIEGAKAVVWDGRSVGGWAAQLDGAHGVVNLAGAPIIKRWTKSNRRAILDSRLETTRALGDAIAAASSPPAVWINASAVGFYGETGSREASEATRPGTGFLADLCQQWEGACTQAATPDTRKVMLRIGAVLAREGKFVRATRLATKLGLGSAIGTGRQYVSWIHISDLVRLVEWCLTGTATGPLNATAPNAVTNSELMVCMRALLCRPPVPPVPAFAVRAAGALLGMEPELLLSGQRAVPEIALARGFRFVFSKIEDALLDVLDTVPEAWKTPESAPGPPQGPWVDF
ncbi:MAG: TIGR01777 family protein [Armatimonadetes bacterium]|nr:TIGR01777 family protein [Armatimonadota bacterium]